MRIIFNIEKGVGEGWCKVKQSWKNPALLLMTVVLLAVGVSCSNKSFETKPPDAGGPWSQPPGVPPGTPPRCVDVLQTINVPLKLLFVVDTSGSNINYQGWGTDPDKAIRGGSIDEFFIKYWNKPNFSWGFLTFSGSTAKSLIGSNSNPLFSPLWEDMDFAIDTFYGLNDNGSTPYREAIWKAGDTIWDDFDSNPETRYVVVFMSDGMPEPHVNINTLMDDVADLVNIYPGRISFNTIYYGPYDPDAANRLYNMANTGGGVFLDTNVSGLSFQIDNTIQIPGVDCTP